MRKYYSDYVRHCARLYFSIDAMPSPLQDKVRYNNYIAVSNVLDRYDKDTTLFLRLIYTSEENLPKMVERMAISKGCKTEALWYIIQTFEKDVATERGLL
jgi:hypothetical protein